MSSGMIKEHFLSTSAEDRIARKNRMGKYVASVTDTVIHIPMANHAKMYAHSAKTITRISFFLVHTE